MLLYLIDVFIVFRLDRGRLQCMGVHGNDLGQAV